MGLTHHPLGPQGTNYSSSKEVSHKSCGGYYNVVYVHVHRDDFGLLNLEQRWN